MIQHFLLVIQLQEAPFLKYFQLVVGFCAKFVAEMDSYWGCMYMVLGNGLKCRISDQLKTEEEEGGHILSADDVQNEF